MPDFRPHTKHRLGAPYGLLESADEGISAGPRAGKPAAVVHPLSRAQVGKGTGDPVLSLTELIMTTAARDSVTLIAHDLIGGRIGWWKAKQRLMEIGKA
jgi:hypothetical protein